MLTHRLFLLILPIVCPGKAGLSKAGFPLRYAIVKMLEPSILKMSISNDLTESVLLGVKHSNSPKAFWVEAMPKTSLSLLARQTACPKCGKHTAVQQPNGAYHCLNCGYHRDLATLDEGSIFGVFSAAVLSVLLAIALI